MKIDKRYYIDVLLYETQRKYILDKASTLAEMAMYNTLPLKKIIKNIFKKYVLNNKLVESFCTYPLFSGDLKLTYRFKNSDIIERFRRYCLNKEYNIINNRLRRKI